MSYLKTTDAFYTTLSRPGCYMIAFVKHGCPHCERMIPEYQQAKQLRPDIPFLMIEQNEIDSTIFQEFRLKGYPTIVFICVKESNSNSLFIQEFNGPRTKEMFIEWFDTYRREALTRKKLKLNPEINMTQFKQCEQTPTSFVVAFMKHYHRPSFALKQKLTNIFNNTNIKFGLPLYIVYESQRKQPKQSNQTSSSSIVPDLPILLYIDPVQKTTYPIPYSSRMDEATLYAQLKTLAN